MFHWYKKYQYAQKNGIKLLMGCEVYLTETIAEKVRDNYHTVLIAKNNDGFAELLQLISTASDPDHFYYDPRITFDEFLGISNNIISTSACLASPLRRLDKGNPYYEQLASKYSYYEIQPHKAPDQMEYNKYLYDLSKAFDKPLILGTDTHSATEFDTECRHILQKAKNMDYDDSEFSLTFWSPEMLISKNAYLEALANTMDLLSVEDVTPDMSVKYPELYDDAEGTLDKWVWESYRDKIDKGIIEDTPERKARLEEEVAVFKQQNMCSFMLFISELVRWCWENNIPVGPCRGSVGGSLVAYLLDIIDLDPIKWKTIFSRFVNADRVSLGDIDLDFAPEDRDRVYQYIHERFGYDKTAYILTINTISDRGTIDEIGRALDIDLKLVDQIKTEFAQLQQRYTSAYNDFTGKDKRTICFLKHDDNLADVPDEYQSAFKTMYSEFEEYATQYPELFKYFRGLKSVAISKGIHPAGIVASPHALANTVGLFMSDGKWVTQLDMEELHDLNYVKYDILGLKNIGIIKQTYELMGEPYQKSHEINWEDRRVWDDMIKSRVGIFQFEGGYAFDMLKQMCPQKVNDMSLANAALRPSGKSYRDRLMRHEINHNPSEEIDELLKDNYGYLVYQEDTIRFLTDICKLSGSTSDSVRRYISDKKLEKLQPYLPKILEGYCQYSHKPRSTAEEEAKQFLQIIEDSARYQFGYNHSTGYSMIGYICAMLRFYHPIEFLTAFLNCAKNDDDTKMGQELAHIKEIKILPIRFGKSQDIYMPDAETNSIYKGIASIKYMSAVVAKEIYEFAKTKPKTFTDILFGTQKTSCDMHQLEILIKLGFFQKEYGNMKKQMCLFELWRDKKLWQRKQFNKEEAMELGLWPLITDYSNETEKLYNNVDMYAFLQAYEASLPNDDFTIYEKIRFQQELLGYIQYMDENMPRGYVYVTDLDTTYSPKAQVYALRTGKSMSVKIYKAKKGKGHQHVHTYFKDEPFKVGDILQITQIEKKPKFVMGDNGKFEPLPGTEEIWVTNYEKISNFS
jgi:DNA polymerase-3 subunit alpha